MRESSLLHGMWIIESKSIVQNIHLEVHFSQFFNEWYLVESIVSKSNIICRCLRSVFHHHIRFHHISDETLDSRNTTLSPIPFWHHIKLDSRTNDIITCIRYPFLSEEQIPSWTHNINSCLFLGWIALDLLIIAPNSYKWAQDSIESQYWRRWLKKKMGRMTADRLFS